MKTGTQLRGMANVSYWADSLIEARAWYTELFGVQPYYQVPDEHDPAYIEFRVGDYKQEVGIIDKMFLPDMASDLPGGSVLYWHVDDIGASYERLLEMGATPFEPITDRSGGKQTYVTASVLDPFGNVIGVMFNKHFLDMKNPDKTDLSIAG